MLIDEYLQRVCFCGVECPLHAILFLIQNQITRCSPHQSFTVRHVHYFSVCRPFPQVCPVKCPGSISQVFPNKPDKNNKSHPHHIPICTLNANVMLCILPHRLASPTLGSATHPHQCHSVCSVTRKSSSLWISEKHFTTPFSSFGPHLVAFKGQPCLYLI